MKPGNRRSYYTHGANSCGNGMFLTDERGARTIDGYTTLNSFGVVFYLATCNIRPNRRNEYAD